MVKVKLNNLSAKQSFLFYFAGALTLTLLNFAIEFFTSGEFFEFYQYIDLLLWFCLSFFWIHAFYVYKDKKSIGVVWGIVSYLACGVILSFLIFPGLWTGFLDYPLFTASFVLRWPTLAIWIVPILLQHNFP